MGDVQINTEPLKKAVKYYKPAWLRNQAAPAADQPAPVVQQPAPVVAEPHPAEFEPEYQSPFAAAPPVGSNLANWLGGNIVAVLQGQENHRNTN